MITKREGLFFISGLVLGLVVTMSIGFSQDAEPLDEEPTTPVVLEEERDLEERATTYDRTDAETIVITGPMANATVSSPLTMTGEARGTWYFEASAPVTLTNAIGTQLSQSYVMTTSDWMTTDFVPFTGTITFPPQPAGSLGWLIFHKDNPSGEPINDASVSVPIIF